MPEHHETSRDTFGGKGGHPFLSWSDVADEAARTALGSSVPIGIVVYQSAGNRSGFYGSLSGGAWEYLGAPFTETGWLSGGDITPNGSTRVDMASGTIRVRGVTEVIEFPAFPAEDPANIATEEFTIFTINAAAELVKFNRALTDAEHATHVEFPTVQHVDNATVTGIDETRFLAEHMTKACADYILENGPLNRGNNYTAAASGLTVKKSIGTTIKLFLRGAASVAAPNPQPNAAVNPVTFLRTIRAGGDFDFFPTTAVPVGFWDNNSGLVATPKFVNHQFRFFNGITGLVVGQATYDTLDEAIAAIFTENPAIPASVTAQRNNLRTVLSVKGDVTDLSSDVDMRFTQVDPGFPGGIVEVGMM